MPKSFAIFLLIKPFLGGLRFSRPNKLLIKYVLISFGSLLFGNYCKLLET